jgi:hypothetical protein
MTQSGIIRQLNEVVFTEIDLSKLQLPKFALILSHNNEVELCIILKIDRKANAAERRFITILTVDQIDTNFYLTKE